MATVTTGLHGVPLKVFTSYWHDYTKDMCNYLLTVILVLDRDTQVNAIVIP